MFGMSRLGHPRINVMLYKATDMVFDSLYRVDTGGLPDRPEFKFGRGYVATPPRAWKLMLSYLPIDPARYTYVDFGCGKGRTMILASDLGFRRIIGVDISPELIEVAQKNMDFKGIAAEFICGDVRDFRYPDEPIVLFMYNPFFQEIMLGVVERLSASAQKFARDIFVVYYSAAFSELWRNSNFFLFRACDSAYPNYAIYRINPNNSDSDHKAVIQ
jgi:SAM-dependent methyltransferase